jgi:co-chaperonin GroES (HSP10)
MKTIANTVSYQYDDIDEAFPPADPGFKPFGSRVLIQIRTPKKTTKGGIIIIDEVRETEHYNTQIGKVIDVGVLAFHNRSTGEPWPEGAWFKVGDYVRVPKYGGDRWTRPTNDGEDEAIFVIFNELDVIGGATGDPRDIKAYL